MKQGSLRGRLALACILLAIAAGGSRAEDLKAILGSIDAINRFSDTYSATLRIASYSPDRTVSECVYRMYAKGMRKALLVFTEPAKDAGKKIAMNGNSMWFYFPKARQSIIVRPVSSLTGSVSVGDTIGSPILDLYDFSASRPTEEGGGLYLDFVAKGAKSPYGRLVYEYRGGRIVKQLAYARSGVLIKIISFMEYAATELGNEYATTIKVQNAVYPAYYSLITIADLKKRDSFPDYYFTPEGLADAGTILP
jgi:outer membrane lipoprotein-sorting protein